MTTSVVRRGFFKKSSLLKVYLHAGSAPVTCLARVTAAIARYIQYTEQAGTPHTITVRVRGRRRRLAERARLRGSARAAPPTRQQRGAASRGAPLPPDPSAGSVEHQAYVLVLRQRHPILKRS
ncbi:hypothetical protein EVAR_11971_1 [Eumeta japonica]|uniref:Uncharacterized protein n=1 Tax=Eumeta variegata TaxID=151549 RepID=A0A4C1U4V4_EUMVA|nr:hypothetical protein EVAR_11971_1 [Eumeta japonica]